MEISIERKKFKSITEVNDGELFFDIKGDLYLKSTHRFYDKQKKDTMTHIRGFKLGEGKCHMFTPNTVVQVVSKIQVYAE